MHKKCGLIKFKNYERKIKSTFNIYADFESILVPENNGKQNQKESYTNILLIANIYIYIACSYGY